MQGGGKVVRSPWGLLFCDRLRMIEPAPRGVIERCAPALDRVEIVDDQQAPISFLRSNLIQAGIGEKGRHVFHVNLTVGAIGARLLEALWRARWRRLCRCKPNRETGALPA